MAVELLYIQVYISGLSVLYDKTLKVFAELIQTYLIMFSIISFYQVLLSHFHIVLQNSCLPHVDFIMLCELSPN